MKDLIDERNKREKMGKSIIKYWNVKYTPVSNRAKEEESAEQMHKCDTSEAMDVENNSAESAEKAELRRQEEEVTRGQIDKILHEKSDEIRNLFEQNEEHKL